MFYQELTAVREAMKLPVMESHLAALQRIERHLITDERTRLSNASREKGGAMTVEQSIELGKSLMELPSESERMEACRLAISVQKAKNAPPALQKMGWWGGVVPE